MSRSPFNIVLIHPEIPPNTGNIGRLCVSTGSHLHLIEPLGFSLEDKHMKRAGLDYWQHLALTVHPSWDAFLSTTAGAPLTFFSTKATKAFWESDYSEGGYLIFGCEGSGLPKGFYQRYEDAMVTIPMDGTFCRSLNLANSVAIALFEGIRRQR